MQEPPYSFLSIKVEIVNPIILSFENDWSKIENIFQLIWHHLVRAIKM